MFLLTIHWDINPVALFTIRWYGILFALAFVFGYYYMNWVFKKEKQPVENLDNLLIFLVAGTVIGARLGHCIFYEPHLYFSTPSQWINVLKIWQGGLASHGAAIGLYIGIFLYSRKQAEQGYLWCLDRLSIPVVLAGSMVRLGNLFNSEIVGHKADVAWAFVFPRAMQLHSDERYLPRHPAQLYEALCYLTVFLIIALLYAYTKAGKRAGLLHGLFLIGIFVSRIGVEFFKRRQATAMEDLPVSMGQVLSIPLIALGVWLVIRSFMNGAAAEKPCST